MTIRTTLIATGLIAASLATASAHAALQGRDLNGSVGSFEAYYDTDLNITWLADANYAKTSGYVAGGLMTWTAANTWAANLSFYNPLTNQTYADWRLPTVNPVNGTSLNYSLSYNGSTDYGYNISEQGTAYAGSTGSEMAHLFYNTLNNKGYCPVSTYCSPAPQTGWGLANTGPFTNLQPGTYWSATEYAHYTSHAWSFNFSKGNQDEFDKYLGMNALAVSPGDVGAVPEADTWAMLLAGLGLVGAAARRRRG
jgi:hypothetical protein